MTFQKTRILGKTGVSLKSHTIVTLPYQQSTKNGAEEFASAFRYCYWQSLWKQDQKCTLQIVQSIQKKPYTIPLYFVRFC